MMIIDIKFLKEKTGCGIEAARQAMILCKNREIAFEFLKLKSHAVARYKKIDDRKIPWDNIDYYMEARRIVENKKR